MILSIIQRKKTILLLLIIRILTHRQLLFFHQHRQHRHLQLRYHLPVVKRQSDFSKSSRFFLFVCLSTDIDEIYDDPSDLLSLEIVPNSQSQTTDDHHRHHRHRSPTNTYNKQTQRAILSALTKLQRDINNILERLNRLETSAYLLQQVHYHFYFH